MGRVAFAEDDFRAQRIVRRRLVERDVVEPDVDLDDDVLVHERQVHALLDREVERGVPAGRIVLAGFSQGCAIALLAGLRYPRRLAGIAGLSGYLPLAATTAAERHAANAATPIFLAHGRDDPMVVLARGTASRDALLGLGYAVQWQDYPMEHSVCMEEVTALNQWLLRVWA